MRRTGSCCCGAPVDMRALYMRIRQFTLLVGIAAGTCLLELVRGIPTGASTRRQAEFGYARRHGYARQIARSSVELVGSDMRRCCAQMSCHAACHDTDRQYADRCAGDAQLVCCCAGLLYADNRVCARLIGCMSPFAVACARCGPRCGYDAIRTVVEFRLMTTGMPFTRAHLGYAYMLLVRLDRCGGSDAVWWSCMRLCMRVVVDCRPVSCCHAAMMRMTMRQRCTACSTRMHALELANAAAELESCMWSFTVHVSDASRDDAYVEYDR